MTEPRPAPGNLRVVQDFVNTLLHATGRDELDSPTELDAWLARRGILPQDVRLSSSDWRTALEVREGLRQLIRGHTAVVATDGVAQRLNETLGDDGLRWRFADDGRLCIDSGGTGWAAVRHLLLLTVYEAMGSSRWQRLKMCHNQTCRRIFYDGARNRMGKWCDMSRCGNPINAKTYRKRVVPVSVAA